MKYQIYYIHGFGSSVNSPTVDLFRTYYPGLIALTYDVNDPSKSILALAKQINSSDSYPIIVGSSLGGWYAEQLTRYVVGDFILYNPAIDPGTTLAKYGVSKDVLFDYRAVTLMNPLKQVSRTVFLCEDDEVIPADKTAIKYSSIAKIIYTSGGHRMTPKNMKKIVDHIIYLKNQIVP